MNIKKSFKGFLTALSGGVVAVCIFLIVSPKEKENIIAIQEKPAALLTSFPAGLNQQVDLTFAAEHSVKAVVHVTTLYDRDSDSYSPWDFFFGNSERRYYHRPILGSGSGVIISEDGYIVTNNHVVSKSDLINVVLYDKRSYKAKLIGQDPTTDLALLKIDETGLSKIEMGNSDELRLGEWVLAVGNPFNLTSTVTAGIISAKARTLGLSSNRMSIEAFLQTDAAVNPGNSGGALVNTKGELVGINTAIESRTGSYSGYSFAIPVTIVKKVVNDLMKFGEVQRAFLGVSIRTVDAYIAEKYGVNKIEGVFIDGVNSGGAAEDAGIKSGDIILSVNNILVNSGSELQEQVSKYRPGDKISVLIKRDEKKKQIELVLRNKLGGASLAQGQNALEILGVEKIEPISNEDKYRLQISRGVKIIKLRNGKLKDNGVKEGFVIFKINSTPIYDVKDIELALQSIESSGVFISGKYPNGQVAYYAFSIND